MTLPRFQFFNDFPQILWKKIQKSLLWLQDPSTSEPCISSCPIQHHSPLLGPRWFALICLSAGSSFWSWGIAQVVSTLPIADHFFSFMPQFKSHFLESASLVLLSHTYSPQPPIIFYLSPLYPLHGTYHNFQGFCFFNFCLPP